MDELEYRRRVMMQLGIRGDKWDGFIFGELPFASSSPTPHIGKYCLTPLIPVVSGHSYVIAGNFYQGIFGTSSQSLLPALLLYDSGKNYTNHYGMLQPTRTVTMPAGYSYARMVFDLDTMEGAYLKDNTTGEYLWRGSDYID